MSTNAIPVPPPPPARRVRIVKVEEPSLASKVMSGAAAVVAPVGAAAGAAAHALAEQSHRSLEKVEQSVAITETAPASVRMNAAKAALKHHCEMLRHQALKMEDTEASGLPVAAAKVSDMSSRATDTVVSAAKSTGGAVVGAARATGESISYATHGIAEKSHKGIEGAEQAAAVSDAVPSQVRFAAASSALEHHQAAAKHAVVKDEKFEASGLSTIGNAIKSGYNIVASGAATAYHAVVGGTETRENADAAAAASHQSA